MQVSNQFIRGIELTMRPVFANKWLRNYVLADQICRSDRVSDAIEFLQQSGFAVADAADDNQNPVFVLSAGWGAGSTLVQRLIISSGEALIWGEPLDETASVHRLAETIAPIREGWPPKAQYAEDYAADSLSGAWIANLIPSLPLFFSSHRSFLINWLTHENVDAGYRRWGLKEVRLTIDHARYLKWLFPNARFVFVYRDLYSCYLSCRNKPWTSVWPNYSATQIVAFAHHWKHLLKGFIDHHKDVDGLLIKYEDLISGTFSTDLLQEHLDLEIIDKSILDKKVGGRSANRHPLILPEKLILDSIAGPLRSEVGYR